MQVTFRLAIILVLLSFARIASAAAYTVINTDDAGAGSLRQAVADAAAHAGADTVEFAPAMSGRTIMLASQIRVDDASGVTIDATALPGGLTIAGNKIPCVFDQYNKASSLTLRGLTITGGSIYKYDGALTLAQCTLSGSSGQDGGAIGTYFGPSTLTDCTLSGNSADDGGAIYIGFNATVEMTQCTLSRNSASSSGGAIYISSSSSVLTLKRCIFSENSTLSAVGGGGAIVTHFGTATLSECAFDSNSAGRGGAIFNSYGKMSFTQCTFSANSSTNGDGGAIVNASDLSLTQCTLSGNSTSINGGGGAICHFGGSFALTQCTLSGNTAGNAGGGAICHFSGSFALSQCTLSGNAAGNAGGGGVFSSRSGNMMLTNSIIAGNSARIGADISLDDSVIVPAGANIIGNNDGVTALFSAGTPNARGDYVGTSLTTLNPQVAALASNGGPTQTMALLPGSFARNHAVAFSPLLTTDQRGRPIFNAPDIGAFENQFGTVAHTLLIPFGSLSGSILCNLETEGTIAASSRNTSLISNESIAITGTGLSRTITINPPAGQSGSSTIVLTHGPSGDTDAFEIYALPAGYIAASISDIADQTMNEDEGFFVIPFLANDAASIFGLTISASSSNTALVSTPAIVPGMGASRALAVTPAANQSGVTTITVVVSDGASTATDTFLLTVNSVNDTPSFIKGADQIAPSNVPGVRSVNNWATAMNKGPADESTQTLSFIVTNDSNALFSVQPAISPDGTLTYTPLPGAEGTATLLVSLQDSGGTSYGGSNTSPAQTAAILIVNTTTPTVVTNASDSGPGSLRQMIAIAAAKTGPDVITFAPALSGQTITLASKITVSDVNGVRVDATSLPAGLTISGNRANGIFAQPDLASSLTLRNLTLINGYEQDSGGAISNGGTLNIARCAFSQNFALYGGAIYHSAGTLTLTQCALSKNSAGKDGGAISNSSACTMTQCTVSGSFAARYGGAISSFKPLTLTQCTLSGNSAGNYGGAIYNYNACTLTQCTLTGNSTVRGHGGAIYTAAGNLALTQCTLFGNSTANDYNGGALFNSNTATKLTHCTLSGNASGFGGAIYNDATLTLTNCIVAANSAGTGRDLVHAGYSFTSAGVNLIGNNGTVSSLFPAGSPNLNGSYVGTIGSPLNARLAPLGSYDGPAQTMALLPGSLARNHASILSPAIASDQRGYPIVGTPDIGAYEAGTTNRFAIWSIENGGGALGFKDDADHDGLGDGLEYATRTSPTAAGSNPLTGPLPIAGSVMQLSFPFRAGASDLRYIVQRTSDLATWSEVYRYDTSTGAITRTGVTAVENFATQIITITDPANGLENFWRMLVELVP